MRLKPGEVGLRGDRATVHLGVNEAVAKGVKPKTDRHGRPIGAVYYQMRPGMVDGTAGKDSYQQRKDMMQVLPTMPVTSDRVVGPVTGLPIDGDEDVFVLRLSKRYNDPNDMSCLQIEVRLPKEVEKPMDVYTQFQEEDYQPPAPAPETKVKAPKKNKGKKGGGKKGKK
ncbi:uncharacterized protein LOC112683178 [Sipha flava]|uniref:Uncharacterized protein LOC112683178 n=1 Tax=Sipha flava TaxID=143950 RepID=A0A2S2QSI9_9HEMI|nr:uncharacterized protein LOC112683178 [Sipha flava]